MKSKTLIADAVILTIAGLITRILGFVYRIYMSNTLGAECVGIYQLIMPIYALAWSISCSGFTTTISKLTAQEKAKGQFGNTTVILKQSLIITFAISVSLNLLFYFCADTFASVIFKEPRTALSLKILSFALPFMSAGSCLRGYFFGLQKSTVPAISQVLEQCIRMGAIYFLSTISINDSLKFSCAIPIVGITVGEAISFLYVYVSYKKFKTQKSKSILSHSAILKMILTMAIPLTANRVVGSLLSAIENVLIPQRLVAGGISSKNAISLYGQVTGMAMPLIYFPSVFLMSLSISLVPAVSQATTVKNFKQIDYTVSKTVLFTSVIGMVSAAFFIIFSKETGLLIYNQDISHILIILGIMCPFLYTQVVLSGILNGLGHQMFIFKNNLLSSAINVAFIYFLIPKKGIDAFLCGWFISLIISSLLDLHKVTKSINIHLNFSELVIKPLISALAAGLTTKLIATHLIFRIYNNILGLIFSAVILCIMYLLFIILTGCISKKELKNLLQNFSPRKFLTVK